MDAEWEGYIVYDAKAGVVRGMTSNPQEAAEIAARYAAALGQETFVWDAAFPHQRDRVAANPADFSGDPHRALLASRVPVLKKDEVMSIALEDAIRVLEDEFRESYKEALSHFPKLTARLKAEAKARGEPFDALVRDWHDEGMVANLLRANYKLEKDYRDPAARPAYIKGLNLVPAFSVFSGIAGNEAVEMPVRGLEDDEELDELLKLKSRRPVPTLCLGANRACMATCLVFTGNNAKSIIGIAPKQAAARSLVKHPHYFMRVLVEATRRFMTPDRHDPRYARFQRYVRLNVISDVPWELVAPWMFEMFPGSPYGDLGMHAFYDYTKVAGREPPANYDLTFSFSGTNYSRAAWELDRGRRVAVVFFFPEAQVEYGKVITQSEARRRTLERERRRIYSDATWLGRQVVDGDVDDVRPRDPGGVWVGLSWKPAKGWAGRTPDLFVLYAVKIDGRFAVAVTPRHTGVPTDDMSEAAVLRTREIIGRGRRHLPTELREEP